MNKQFKSIKTFQPKKTKNISKSTQNLNLQILQKSDLVISLLKKQYQENQLYQEIQSEILIKSQKTKQFTNLNYQFANSFSNTHKNMNRSGAFYSNTSNNVIDQSIQDNQANQPLAFLTKNKIQRTRINSVNDMKVAQNQIDSNYTNLLSCKQIKANKNYSFFLQPFMQQYYVFDMKQYVFPLKIIFLRVMAIQSCILYIGFDKPRPGQNLSKGVQYVFKSNYPKQHDLKMFIQKKISFQINKKGNKVVNKIYFMFTTKKNTFQATFKILSGLQSKQTNQDFMSSQIYEQLQKKDKFLLSITSHPTIQKTKKSRNQMIKTLSSDFMTKQITKTISKSNSENKISKNNSESKINKNYSASKIIKGSLQKSKTIQKDLNNLKSHFLLQNKDLKSSNSLFQKKYGKISQNSSKIQSKAERLFSLTSFSYLNDKNIKKFNITSNQIKTQNSQSLQKKIQTNMNTSTDAFYSNQENNQTNQAFITKDEFNLKCQNSFKMSPVKDKKQKIQLWIQKNNELKNLVKSFKQIINQYHNQTQELKLRSKKITKNMTICILLIKFMRNSYISYQKKKKYLESVFKINYFISTFLRNLKKKHTQSKIMVRDKNYRINYGILPLTQLLSKTLYKSSVSNAEKVISTTFQRIYISLASLQILCKSDILVNKIKKVQLRYKQTHKARIKMLVVFSKNHIAKMTNTYSHFKMFQNKILDSKNKILHKICLQYLKDQILKFNLAQSAYRKKINEIQKFKLINQKLEKGEALNKFKKSPFKFKTKNKNQKNFISPQKGNKKINFLSSLPKQFEKNKIIKVNQQNLSNELLQIPKNPIRPQKRIFRNLDILRSMIRSWFQIQYKKWQKKNNN